MCVLVMSAVFGDEGRSCAEAGSAMLMIEKCD
jgi:hypothetical protein